LRDKCGSGSTEKEFYRPVGKIIEDDRQHDHMPDYAFNLEDNLVVVRPKRATLQTTLSLPVSSLQLGEDKSFEEARCCAPGWDVQALAQDWRSWVLEKNISVKESDAHFLSFCLRRGPYKTFA
jgi:hypothetical protein